MGKTKKIRIAIFQEDNKWNFFYFFIFLVGIVLLVFEILIFRKTFIESYIPIIITLFFGFIAFYFNKQHYKKTYPSSGNFIAIIQNVFSWGIIFCYLFMAANYYFADTISKNYRVKIKEKSSLPRSKGNKNERQPLVRIDYFGFEKELVFKFKDTEKVNSADSVKVCIKKGGLGFDILQSYDVF